MERGIFLTNQEFEELSGDTPGFARNRENTIKQLRTEKNKLHNEIAVLSKQLRSGADGRVQELETKLVTAQAAGIDLLSRAQDAENERDEALRDNNSLCVSNNDLCAEINRLSGRVNTLHQNLAKAITERDQALVNQDLDNERLTTINQLRADLVNVHREREAALLACSKQNEFKIAAEQDYLQEKDRRNEAEATCSLLKIQFDEATKELSDIKGLITPTRAELIRRLTAADAKQQATEEVARQFQAERDQVAAAQADILAELTEKKEQHARQVDSIARLQEELAKANDELALTKRQLATSDLNAQTLWDRVNRTVNSEVAAKVELDRARATTEHHLALIGQLERKISDDKATFAALEHERITAHESQRNMIDRLQQDLKRANEEIGGGKIVIASHCGVIERLEAATAEAAAKLEQVNDAHDDACRKLRGIIRRYESELQSLRNRYANLQRDKRDPKFEEAAFQQGVGKALAEVSQRLRNMRAHAEAGVQKSLRLGDAGMHFGNTCGIQLANGLLDAITKLECFPYVPPTAEQLAEDVSAAATEVPR